MSATRIERFTRFSDDPVATRRLAAGIAPAAGVTSG
jgi:hypothetical protein